MPVTYQDLMHYLAMQKQNENILQRIADMKANEYYPSGGASDGSQHTGSAGDRMARAVERRLAYESTYLPTVEHNKTIMAEIERTVRLLPDYLEQEVLRLRYLDSTSCRQTRWPEIALALYGDDDEKYLHAVMRIHKKAIHHIESIV